MCSPLVGHINKKVPFYTYFIELFSFIFSLEETKEELEEFQISSRELEAELEAQLEQLEKKNSTLNQNNQKLQHEVDSLRVSQKSKY